MGHVLGSFKEAKVGHCPVAKKMIAMVIVVKRGVAPLLQSLPRTLLMFAKALLGNNPAHKRKGPGLQPLGPKQLPTAPSLLIWTGSHNVLGQ